MHTSARIGLLATTGLVLASLATAAAAEPKLRKIVLGILAHEAGAAP